MAKLFGKTIENIKEKAENSPKVQKTTKTLKTVGNLVFKGMVIVNFGYTVYSLMTSSNSTNTVNIYTNGGNNDVEGGIVKTETVE